MLSVREIAADLQLTTATVSQKLKRGEIPGGTRLFGGPWKVNPHVYEAFKEELANPKRDPYLLEPRSKRAQAAHRR